MKEFQEWNFVCHSIEDMYELWLKIQNINPNCRICLVGDLGAGKTTLVKQIVANLNGDAAEVTSPTFSLVNIYPFIGGDLYHLDLYRLNSLDEAIQMGIEEYLEYPNVIIEWPQIIYEILPGDFLHVKIERQQDESRTVTIRKFI